MPSRIDPRDPSSASQGNPSVSSSIRPGRWRLIAAIVSAAAAATAAGTLAAPAHAGSYTAAVCTNGLGFGSMASGGGSCGNFVFRPRRGSSPRVPYGLSLRSAQNTTIVDVRLDRVNFENRTSDWYAGVFRGQTLGSSLSPMSGGSPTLYPPGTSAGPANAVIVGAACQRSCDEPTTGLEESVLSFGGVSATVVDFEQPKISGITIAGTNGGWARPGPIAYSVTASDNTGIRRLSVFADDILQGNADQSCNYGAPMPCPDGALSNTVPVGANYDGRHTIAVRATDATTDGAAINSIVSSGTVSTDGSAPGEPASNAVGGTGWRNQDAFEFQAPVPASENDPDGAGPRGQAPIRSTVTVCPAGFSEGPKCFAADVKTGVNAASPKFTLGREGAWQARVVLVDQAGNVGAPGRWIPTQLDTSPPTPLAALAPQGGGVVISATDKFSGTTPAPADQALETGGSLSYRIDEQGDWTTVRGVADGPTGSNAFVGLPAGPHIVEVRATDVARNTSSVARYGLKVIADRGAPNGTGPLTEDVDGSQLVAWFDTKSKRTPRPVSKVAGLRDTVTIRGQLLSPSGAPVGGATIDLVSAVPLRASVRAADQARTNADGVFAIVLPKSQPSRSLTVQYRARVNDESPTASATLKLTIRPKLTLRASRSRVGRATAFTGSTTAAFLPKKGKLIELQYLVKKRWVTFKTARTDRSGRWHTTHRFAKRATWKIRARVPSEAEYPFQGRSTTPITVRVR